MRLILYMGKGGVGKTTVAAASALRCAELGYRTLVASTDIAHSLADALDYPLAAAPVPVAANLWGQEISVLDEVRTYWHELRGLMAAMLRHRNISPVIAEEIAIAPGMEELLGLLQLHKQARSQSFDVIIVDAAPTGETIRLLTVPETFQWYVARLLQWGESALKPSQPFGMLPLKKIAELLTRLDGEVAELRQTLIDPEVSSYRIVFNPEKLVIKETQRAVTYMSLFGYPVDAGIINRVLPASQPTDDSFLRRMQEVQRQHLDTARDTFAPLPLFEAPWRSDEVVGLEALGRLARGLWNDLDPTRVFWRGPLQQIEKSGDEFILRLPLRHVEIDKLKLVKRGDEFFISVGNFKREFTLPHVLAIREATGARLANDGSLEICFAESAP